MDRSGESIPAAAASSPGGREGSPPAGEVESRLSRNLVDFYKEIYGRGPATVTTLLSAEVAVTVLHAVLTPGEHTLVAGGKLAEVEQMRMRTAELVKPQLIPLAEAALGAEVTGSVTGIGPLGDVATETFLLAPSPGPNAS